MDALTVTRSEEEYVSASRLRLWLKCPLAYRLRYVDGIRTPTNANLFVGRQVHAGLELYYRYRQRGVRLYPEFVAAHVRKHWSEAAAEDGVEFESGEKENEAQRKTVSLLETYIAQVPLDEPAPLEVERRFEAPLVEPNCGEGLGVNLLGVIDLVLDGDVIVDFKTAARSPSTLDATHELQMSCYAYLYRQVTGRRESGIEMRTLVKTKVPKIVVTRFGPRSDEHFSRLFSVIRAYLEMVRSGRYHPRPGLECSWCEHREERCGDGLVQIAA